MSFTAEEWKADYEGVKGQIIQVRGDGGTERTVSNVERAVERLEIRLGVMEQNPTQFSIGDPELARRRELVRGLRKQLEAIKAGPSRAGAPGNASSFDTGSGGAFGPRTVQQMRKDIMKEQDDLLGDLEKGVGRLGQQSRTLHDEAQLHKRLLDDIDGDIDAAGASLRVEARHAAKVREASSVCRLYMCIFILVVILVLLLIIGFS